VKILRYLQTIYTKFLSLVKQKIVYIFFLHISCILTLFLQMEHKNQLLSRPQIVKQILGHSLTTKSTTRENIYIYICVVSKLSVLLAGHFTSG